MMFGDKIDSQITMLQRVVALTRDLVIAIVALFTSLIIYYGGDPTKLNALDWFRLVTAVFLIVIGPIVVFVAFRTIYSFIYGFSNS